MRPILRSAVACLAVVCLLAGAGAAMGAQHQSAYSLQPDFMCVSCHEPLNQVNSPEAVAEKDTLAQLVAKDLSYNAIKAQMVSIYGEEVLAQPPAHGVSLLVYILPPLVLVCGLGLLAYNLPRWRRRARAAEAEGAGPIGPPLDRADAQRLEHELADFDG
jgi:cytochrome c-type biogenesis protein CcmH